MNTDPKLKKIQGLSIVELMIAISLGAAMSIGLMQVFFMTQNGLKNTENMTRMMENVQFAISNLRTIANFAGHQALVFPVYFGCYPDNSVSPHAFLSNTVTAGGPNACANSIVNSGTGLLSFGVQGSTSCWTGNNGDPRRFATPTPDKNSSLLDSACGGTSSPPGASNTNAIYVLEGSNQVIPYFSGITSSNTNGDTLRIRYQGDVASSNIVDCFGYSVGSNEVIENVLSIAYDSWDTNQAHPYLSCTVNSIDPVTGASLGIRNGESGQLVPNVKAFRVLYGVDTDGDGVVNQYMAEPFSASNHAQVITIQIALLMQTQDEISTQTDTTVYNLLNTYNHGPYNDKRIRKLYSMTLMTGECVPPYRSDCTGQGVNILTKDWLGNVSTTQMKMPSTGSGPVTYTVRTLTDGTTPCSSGTLTAPYITTHSCTLDAQGNLTAKYTDRCAPGVNVGTSIPYGSTNKSIATSSTTGNSSSCQFR